MNIYQISVFLENRAGQLAEITGILAENNIDMRAISIAETSDYGVLRVIVNDAEKATTTLLSKGYVLSMTPVYALAVDDAPGGLAPVLAALAEANVDIEYMYSLFIHKEGKAYMVFRVSNEDSLLAVLAKNGLATVSAQALGLK